MTYSYTFICSLNIEFHLICRPHRAIVNNKERTTSNLTPLHYMTYIHRAIN